MNEIKQLRGIPDFRELRRKRSFRDIWAHDLTPEQISVDLKSDFMYRLEQDQELQRIQEEREALPVKNFESEILDAIHHNSVVVIRGATGCGKTTQVPQYILDLSSLLPAPLQSSLS